MLRKWHREEESMLDSNYNFTARTIAHKATLLDLYQVARCACYGERARSAHLLCARYTHLKISLISCATHARIQRASCNHLNVSFIPKRKTGDLEKVYYFMCQGFRIPNGILERTFTFLLLTCLQTSSIVKDAKACLEELAVGPI